MFEILHRKGRCLLDRVGWAKICFCPRRLLSSQRLGLRIVAASPAHLPREHKPHSFTGNVATDACIFFFHFSTTKVNIKYLKENDGSSGEDKPETWANSLKTIHFVE